MSKIGLIIAREYKTRVRKKTFIIMTILGPLLMGGFLSAAIWLGTQDESVHHVLVADEGGLFYKRMKDSEKIKFDIQNKVITEEDFKKDIYKEYDLLLSLQKEILKSQSVTLTYRQIPSSGVERYISEQVNGVIEKLKVEDAKIKPEVYDYIKGSHIDIKLKDLAKENEKSRYLSVLGFFFAIFIYLFIFLYGAQVMRGVIEEKTNRVVEVIISSVKPFELMMGKIIGIAMVGLTQFLIWILTMFLIFGAMKSYMFTDMYDPSVAAQAAENIKNVQGGSSSELYSLLFEQINYPAVISIFIFYFLAGYLLYASLFAAVGAVVDSEADSQQFMLPISVPLVFAYIISAMGIENPEGSAQVWSSIIPFTSPVGMMVRAVTGTVPGWQIALSMTLLVGAFLFTVWVGARLYRTGILMYGKKPTYRELWKWLRYKS